MKTIPEKKKENVKHKAYLEKGQEKYKGYSVHAKGESERSEIRNTAMIRFVTRSFLTAKSKRVQKNDHAIHNFKYRTASAAG